MATAGDPIAVMRAFDAAWNTHDQEAVVACFAADAVVTQVPPPPPTHGRHDGGGVSVFVGIDPHDEVDLLGQ